MSRLDVEIHCVGDLDDGQVRPALDRLLSGFTKGEMTCAFASAARTACGSENINVRLQRIPSFCSCSAAFNPSQVDAILINTRSRGILRSL